MNLINGGQDVLLAIGLHMAGNDVRSGVAELVHIPHGPIDHQVHVQRQLCHGTDALDYRNANGDIGHEQAVHHVHMDVIGGGNCFNVPAQVGKIRGQDRGRDFDHGKRSFLFSG